MEVVLGGSVGGGSACSGGCVQTAGFTSEVICSFCVDLLV